MTTGEFPRDYRRFLFTGANYGKIIKTVGAFTEELGLPLFATPYVTIDELPPILEHFQKVQGVYLFDECAGHDLKSLTSFFECLAKSNKLNNLVVGVIHVKRLTPEVLSSFDTVIEVP